MALDGVTEATVGWETGRARVRHRDGLDPAELVRAVEDASRGTIHQYDAQVISTVDGEEDHE